MIDLYNKIRKRYLFQYIDLLYFDLFSHRSRNNEIIVFDTSIESDNLGDQIINFYCNAIFSELALTPTGRVPTHRGLTKQEMALLTPSSLKIITGTNILSSHMNLNGTWCRPLQLKRLDNLCLFGAGWNEYSEEMNSYTKLFYRTLLDKKFLHSVRDSYTEKKFRMLGIQNVINTACPTMWGLTHPACELIPKKKAAAVITTITDYDKNKQLDWFMLDTLLNHYYKVYIWIQGSEDLKYIHTYPQFNKLFCVDRTLESYNQVLKLDSVDYIGTRLHAGIHALNNRKRSLIISIDNRARELAKDTNLPVLERTQIPNKLENYILHDHVTEINLPTNAIRTWKRQFKI